MKNKETDAEFLGRMFETLHDYVQKSIASNRRHAEVMINLKKFNEQKQYNQWKAQSDLDAVARIQAFASKFKSYKIQYSSASEEDFIQEELSENTWFLKQINLRDTLQKKAYFHIKKYVEFLQEHLNQIQEEKKQLPNEQKKYSHLPFTINRSQLTGLMILLKDAGILAPITDYQLACFLQEHCYHSASEPMKQILTEISKYRNYEKDPKKMSEFLKSILSGAEIRTKDDLKD